MLPAGEYRNRTFDRFPSRDERRSLWPFPDEIPKVTNPWIKSWESKWTSDQGREGACVGHGLTTDAVASPYPGYHTLTTEQVNTFAHLMYKWFQTMDPWSGEDYEGTSVDAGFKGMRQLGWIKEWRWLETVDRIRDAVLQVGPVVLGVDWTENMYETRPSGLVEIGGTKVGGHCITIIGYHPGMRIAGEDWNARYEVFKWKNSWGTGYGKNGVGYITRNDLATLMAAGGEAAIAMGRSRVRVGDYLKAHAA